MWQAGSGHLVGANEAFVPPRRPSGAILRNVSAPRGLRAEQHLL